MTPLGTGVRKVLIAIGAAGLVAVVAVGLISAGGNGGEDPRSALSKRSAEALGDAPGALGDLYSQANELLGGGPGAFRDRIDALEGHPVVVNKWASWCGPCRAEFPFFQRQAARRGRRVAFLGVNSNDSDGDARRFLERFPVPYPSYRDPDGRVSAVFKAVVAFPSTAFYDSRGDLVYLKQGGYRTEADLAADIEQYAG
jgi:thiol-disulfide isomerase/thioredoxin